MMDCPSKLALRTGDQLKSARKRNRIASSAPAPSSSARRFAVPHSPTISSVGCLGAASFPVVRSDRLIYLVFLTSRVCDEIVQVIKRAGDEAAMTHSSV
jgi:hypothetical protein